jgi:hypothetical protein
MNCRSFPPPPPADTADGPCAMSDIEWSSPCGLAKLLCVGTTVLAACNQVSEKEPHHGVYKVYMVGSQQDAHASSAQTWTCQIK